MRPQKSFFTSRQIDRPGGTLVIAQAEAHEAPGPLALSAQPVLGRREYRREFPRDHDKGVDLALDTIEATGAGRAKLATDLWAGIPAVIDEYWSSPSSLTAQVYPQTGNFETIETVVATVPAGATAVLQLGDRSYYLSEGVTNLMGLRVQLGPSDLRLLTVSLAGPISLELCGRVSPLNAKMPNN